MCRGKQMKKILGICAGLLVLGACASVPVQSCGENLARPYFFEQGETLAAFRLTVVRGEQGLDGILQIKKIGDETYEVTLYAVAGGYRIFQATLTREKTEYTFLTPAADHGAVRIKAERFLNLLLFPAQSQGKCKVKSDRVRVRYKHAPMVYTYDVAETYPAQLTGPKSFGKVKLYFEDYEPYEDGQLPHTLHYKDGKVQIDLTLLRLKK